MKVLFLIDTLDTGGAEKSILEICSRLQTIQPSVCVIHKASNDLKQEYQKKKIPVYELDIKKQKFWGILKAAKKLKHLITELKPDIVHAHLFNAELAARFIPSKTFILAGAFVNDSYSQYRYGSLSLFQKLKLNSYRFIDRISAGAVHSFTSVSHAIKTTNCNALNIPPEKVTVLYRGRSISDFYRSGHKAANETFVFVVVARLLQRKGYFELIDAVKELHKKNISFKVVAAGDGVDGEAIRNYCSEKGVEHIIEFIGNSKNVPALLRESDCFIMPSHYEGQGGALVEAMLSGLPIIASDIPVFREQVTADVSARLFTVGDAHSLAQQMEWMLQNRASAAILGVNAKAIAVERFDIEKIARQYESYYLGLIQSHKH